MYPLASVVVQVPIILQVWYLLAVGLNFYKVFLHKEATVIKDAKTNMAFKVNGFSVTGKLSFC